MSTPYYYNQKKKKKSDTEEIRCYKCHKYKSAGVWMRINRYIILCKDCMPCGICARRKLIECDAQCPNAKQTRLL